jgi:endonuclease/exonuclease/phosphatase family metal-dependent hydrolase
VKKTIAVVLLGIALYALCCRAPAPLPVRFATFNIENYPKHDRQVDAAFREIAALGASFVAVQEIVDPALFARTAQLELGLGWDFVAASTAPRQAGAAPRMVQHLGVLFDRAIWTLASTAVHEGTRLEQGRYKPVLEVRLAPRAGGPIVRVLVVHLKAGGEDGAIRARQYAALADIVRAARDSGERVVTLGDFNATGDADREALAVLADATGTRWLTASLACSALWDRDDGCFRSRLDHVLATEPARTVTAAGACATHGCAMEPSCPLYADEVSDHCPVVVEL